MFTNIKRCCIVLRYQEISINNETKYERCFSESNKCSAQFAIPVCVDLQMKFNSIVIPPAKDEGSSIISVDLSTDYLCGDDIEYHFIGEYCYKINLHETNWAEEKSQCQHDNAMLFLPKNEIALNLIKIVTSTST
ncbi:unnamed protein product [Rotaria magnacalcarata]|uniref:C-type lectin domain-containing protein n=2 Tax=Rotaria magnacalcarata TaxID=392030 RepID=A0A819K1A1_9BILA|nr:unnamed protein product [Rotaria magnacalcarata]CAF1682718.1 unnamed protein product [Rotaria magnacalcarata]CAF2129152.1 unnamed protein product [Rotaria magnacalcarata]CAF3939447.1 unnamed protein product [Rotaria magnacalcarata]CAF4812899.1 unnamed protein product [Rotaria magnacalcarata]